MAGNHADVGAHQPHQRGPEVAALAIRLGNVVEHGVFGSSCRRAELNITGYTHCPRIVVDEGGDHRIAEGPTGILLQANKGLAGQSRVYEVRYRSRNWAYGIGDVPVPRCLPAPRSGTSASSNTKCFCSKWKKRNQDNNRN